MRAYIYIYLREKGQGVRSSSFLFDENRVYIIDGYDVFVKFRYSFVCGTVYINEFIFL